ncbi:MAG: hypothetical protein Q8Q04_02080 [archaeon]|nr:hypothetical protein [archaeon]
MKIMENSIEKTLKDLEEGIEEKGFKFYKTINNPEFLSRFLLNFHLKDQSPFWDMEEYILIPTEKSGEHKVYVHYGHD